MPCIWEQNFQKEAGCSFAQYLSNTKNGIAKDLILNTNMKINDISKEVGYPDTSYFYRKFKQCYGVSPASLRNMKKYEGKRSFHELETWKEGSCPWNGYGSGCCSIFRVSRSGKFDRGKDLAELTWYQVGDRQKDDTMVLEAVNEYLAETIGVKLNIIKVGWGDYSQKMQVVIATEDEWDLCFTSSWTNDYLQNAQKGAFWNLRRASDEKGEGDVQTYRLPFLEGCQSGR